MTWKKGMPSPNPGGRLRGVRGMVEAAVAQVAKVEREDALRRVIEEFAKLAFDKRIPPKLRFEALQELMDRGLGKPAQTQVNLNIETEVRTLSNDELRQRIAELAGSDPALSGLLGGPRVIQSTGGAPAPSGDRATPK